MKRLTVLHVDTERGWRGGERQALWLARELQLRGHRSIIAARPDEPLAERSRDAGIEVVECAARGGVDPVAALALRRVLRSERIDLLHAHTSHGASLGAIATLGTKVPFVISRRVDFALRGGLAARWKYGRAFAVVAISREVARVVERAGIPPDRIVVVPDGVDLARVVTPASVDVLRELGVAPGAPLVVQVAQLVGHKDPLNFVRAMRTTVDRVPGVHALIVGDGPLRDAVVTEVRRLALADAVHVLGYRNDADSLLAAADVATLSSEEEGMGSVLLDAMMFGKAIAATTAGGIPEVVEHGVTGLLAPPHDARALGDNIAALLLDPARRAAIGAAGRARVESFSVQRMTDRTLAVYERILGP